MRRIEPERRPDDLGEHRPDPHHAVLSVLDARHEIVQERNGGGHGDEEPDL